MSILGLVCSSLQFCAAIFLRKPGWDNQRFGSGPQTNQQTQKLGEVCECTYAGHRT